MIALVAAWGAAGLVILGRTDALGAITGALLIYVLLRGRAATLYAGVFLMVGFLEIYGTSIGAWHWAATHARHAAARRQPPKRDRGRLRALRRRRDRASAARARCTQQGAGAPAAGTAGRHTLS